MTLPEPEPETFEPRMWDKTPDTVVHIAGAQLSMFGRYLRQRCDWCGVVIIEYDLTRVQVPVGQDFAPAMWAVGSMVRVDGHMSAEVEMVEDEPGIIKLPPDSCAFNPMAAVGFEVHDLQWAVRALRDTQRWSKWCAETIVASGVQTIDIRRPDEAADYLVSIAKQK